MTTELEIRKEPEIRHSVKESNDVVERVIMTHQVTMMEEDVALVEKVFNSRHKS